MRSTSALLASLSLISAGAEAQCKVASGSSEGKLLAFYAVPIVFSPATAPRDIRKGSIRLGLEGEYIPTPSAAIRRTGKCFLQKDEHTSISPIFVRPRVTIGLPGSIAIEGSYLPPIKIANARPNLGSVAISHVRHFGPNGLSAGVDAMLRGNATFGNVKGPITCPKSSLQQSAPTLACYGSAPSNDRFEPRMYGLDLLLGVTPRKDGPNLYGGIGANRIDPHFQVGFTSGTGATDRTNVQLEQPSMRFSMMAGVTARAGARLDWGVQVYSVPTDAKTFRVHTGLNF